MNPLFQSSSSAPRPSWGRRRFLRRSAAASALLGLGLRRGLAAATVQPQSVQELWADFDPRRDPLEVEQIREWQEDGGVFRHVRFLVGTFKGVPARMTAIYGFPAGAREKLPAVMHIHGGGQRAFLHEVKLLVGRGYAALSVNWDQPNGVWLWGLGSSYERGPCFPSAARSCTPREITPRCRAS